MGVYVKYMEMPEGCVTCYLKHDCCDFKQQVSSGNIIKYIDKRLDCCPLVEVVGPHGDLIDRNEMQHLLSIGGLNADLAKTVIEAEGE
jgi:hypothetical protein